MPPASSFVLWSLTGCSCSCATWPACLTTVVGRGSGEYIITDNVVEDGGDGCIAMNNNAFGIVANNILRRCSLGVGAGPAGALSSETNSTPFTVTSNLIEDCNYGVLLGWFGYKDRLGPMNCVISNNIIRRPRSCGIQNNGAPGSPDGVWIVQGNQITQAGYTQGRYAAAMASEGPGNGIYAGSLRDVQIIGNSITAGQGRGIFASGLHFIVSSNVLVAGTGPGANATGIYVGNSEDMNVAENSVRGYAHAIVATDKDTIRIRGNSIDVSHSPVASGIEVKAGVARAAVVDNAVTGAGGAASRCVALGGPASASRVERDNLCW